MVADLVEKYAVQQLGLFDGKQLEPTTKEGLGNVDVDEKEKLEEMKAELEPMTKCIKKVRGDKVFHQYSSSLSIFHRDRIMQVTMELIFEVSSASDVGDDCRRSQHCSSGLHFERCCEHIVDVFFFFRKLLCVSSKYHRFHAKTVICSEPWSLLPMFQCLNNRRSQNSLSRAIVSKVCVQSIQRRPFSHQFFFEPHSCYGEVFHRCGSCPDWNTGWPASPGVLFVSQNSESF